MTLVLSLGPKSLFKRSAFILVDWYVLYDYTLIQLMKIWTVTMAGQRVTNNNVIQQIAMPVAIIKHLQIKTSNKFTKLN